MHNDDDLEMEVEAVTLRDDAGRSIVCTIEHTIEVDGQEFVLLIPIDAPVEIFAWHEVGDEEEEAMVVEDPAEINRLFPIAKAVLEEQNLTLKRTAVTLTVEGELPELDEESEDLFDSDEEGDELQYLASFYSEEQEYAVYSPLEPFFILARIDEHNQPQLLSAAELEKLEPLLPEIEAQILEQFDE